jgi:phage gpG-like protein
LSSIRFSGWRDFEAQKDRSVIRRFLDQVATDSEKAFKRGMRSKKSGKTYSGRSGKRIRASAAGEYPAIDTGELDASIGTRTTDTETTIGTNKFYAKFLREGTGKMARRRMSDDALTEGIKTARHRLKGFVTWKRT